MLKTKDVQKALCELGAPKNLIYLCYRGSISHNTYVPNLYPNSVNDIDLLGVFLSPPEYYTGLSQHKLENPTTIEIMKPVDGVLFDCVFYEIRHFVGMALKSNPNIFSALWVKPDHHILLHNSFKSYIKNRHVFMSRRQIYKSFTGYADDQLKKMTHFNKKGYMGEKRSKIVEKFGYDCYNASHLIRLLHTGIESLQTGKVKVFRDVDVDMLIDIKLGKWKLEEVKMYAGELFHQARKAYEASSLPEEPNTRAAERILMRILYIYLTKSVIKHFFTFCLAKL